MSAVYVEVRISMKSGTTKVMHCEFVSVDNLEDSRSRLMDHVKDGEVFWIETLDDRRSLIVDGTDVSSIDMIALDRDHWIRRRSEHYLS